MKTINKKGDVFIFFLRGILCGFYGGLLNVIMYSEANKQKNNFPFCEQNPSILSLLKYLICHNFLHISSTSNHDCLASYVREQRTGHCEDTACSLCGCSRSSEGNISMHGLFFTLSLLLGNTQRNLLSVRTLYERTVFFSSC